MRRILPILLTFIFTQSFSQPANPNRMSDGKRQGKWTILVDKDWNEIPTKSGAAYYRIIDYKDGKPQGVSRDYTISGQLQWEGQLISDTPDVNDGLCIWYEPDGNKSKEITYRNGVMDGKAVYYMAGKKYSEGTYSQDKLNRDWIYYGNDYNSYYQTGVQALDNGKFNEAVESLQKAILLARKTYGEYSSFEMNAHWDLSLSYQSLGLAAEMERECREVIRLNDRVKSTEDKYIIEFVENTANNIRLKGKSERCVPLFKLAAAWRERISLMEGARYYWDLKYVLDIAFAQKKYDSIEYYFEKITAFVPITEETYPSHLRDWTSFFINHKTEASPDKIERQCQNYLKEKEKRNEKDGPYVTGLISYGRLLAETGQAERALRCFTDARNVLEPVKEKNKRMYIWNFSCFATLVNETKKYDATQQAWFADYEKYIELWKTDLKETNHYNSSLMDIINYNFNRGDLLKTEALIRKAMDVEKAAHGEKSTEYKMLNVFLAGLLEKQGKKAESQDIVKSISKEDESQLIDNLGLTQAVKDTEQLGKYLLAGQYATAITLFEKSSDMINSYFEKKGEYTVIVQTLCGISLCYRETGNFQKAFSNLKQARDIVSKQFPQNHDMNAFMLLNEGEFYQITGNLTKAEVCFVDGMKILDDIKTKENEAENDEAYYNLANRLASLYMAMYRFTLAEKYFNQVASYQYKKYGKDSPAYAGTLVSLADVNRRFDEYYLAQEKLAQALPVLKKLGEYNQTYIEAEYGQANLYLDRFNYQAAEPLYLKNQAFYKKAQGTKSDNYLMPTSQLGTLYSYSGQLDKAGPILRELNQFHLYRLSNFFPTLSEDEKALYYKKVYAQINAYNSFARRYYQQHPEESGIMYDLQLQTKGLLFRATNRVKETIMTTKDDSLKVMFQRWQANKDLLANVYQMSEAEKKQRGINEQALEARTLDLEKQMTRRSEFFSDLIKITPSWKGVQQKLLPGEAAVEIVKIIEMYPEYRFSYIGKGIRYDTLGADGCARITEIISERTAGFRTGMKEGDIIVKMNGEPTKGKSFKQLDALFGTSAVMLEVRKKDGRTVSIKVPADSVFQMVTPRRFKYAALILTSETKLHPELVVLENGNELESKYGRYYQNAIKQKLQDKYSYDQFWKPIQAKLSGVKKVYFSPDGVYNFVNPSTFYNPSTGKYLIDELDVVIVGNTGDILTPAKIGKAKNAVLIGFPDYNKTGSATAKKSDYTSDMDYSVLKGDSSTRFMDGSSVAELPGTKVEVMGIETLLKGSGIEVSTLMAQNATEEKVKSLKSPRVLHIATHGFFLDDTGLSVRSDERSITGVTAQKLAENPLLRAGLLFAGAGKTITQGKESATGEDGILTAYEAMNLNLIDTELIVLSACETGLGEIKSGEGVYGLQRAFTAAGAKNVLMSLWKVDDEATQQLMTSFYREWIATDDKRLAIRSAQMKLRQKYPDPYYWGAFEMVGR